MERKDDGGKDTFINPNEIDEEIGNVSDEAEPMDEDEGDEELQGNDDIIEIDMSNNSWAYFDKHQDSVFKVISHPFLPIVVSGGADNTAFMWTSNSQPPKLITELKGHTESVIAGGFTKDGSYIITGDMTGKVLVHKAFKKYQQWRKIAEINEISEISWIEVHPVQNFFAFGGIDGSVWCYSIENDNVEQVFSGFNHSIECTSGKFVDVDDIDSLLLITCSEDSSIVFWNCYTSEPIFKLTSNDFKSSDNHSWVTISALDNSKIVAVGSRDGVIAILNYETIKILNTIKAIDLKESDDIYDSSVEALAWCSVENSTLLAVGLVSGDLTFYDSKSWRIRKSVKLEDAITKLEFIKDENFLIGSCMNGRIYKWNVLTGKEEFVGVGHNLGILDFCVQDKGNKLITAGDEGVSLVFNLNK
ncbi:Sqt1p [Ascoidea rubescens DSM 1968]|uniref:Putative ribosome assembly protein n=1 Tax=Ascoidea rubescens DSM 1968 TaxID=1344418 RepID=A0A1D2VEN2_9ASCO|nr:putative ribosome assembly protein [Ascoidea rubescens DSM 1968]ODV60158.1 putative ribosome assembly protein [Ascoidea rubescens DSM 1968]